MNIIKFARKHVGDAAAGAILGSITATCAPVAAVVIGAALTVGAVAYLVKDAKK